MSLRVLTNHVSISSIPCLQEYLDVLLKAMRDQDLEHMFAHVDERVYDQLAHIIWKDSELYRNTVILMGAFHELRIRQKNYLQKACS